MKQIVLCWIHIWKLFLYGSYKRGLRYSPSKFGNWWFQRKKKSHLECCYAKKLFTHVFDLRKKETTKKTYNCLGGETRYCLQKETFFELWKRLVFRLFRRWLPSAYASYKPQMSKTALLCLNVVGHEPQILLFVLLETFPGLFLGSSTRSFLLSRLFLHNSLKKRFFVCLEALQW